jgi:ribosomal protein S18 acetylase RimI-like enzyme
MPIRPLDPVCDFPALAALFATRDPEPPMPELLHEWESNAPAGLVRQRLVALDDAGALVGYCDAVPWPWDAPNAFALATLVAPNFRRQRLGAQLADAALAFAREQGATRLVAEVRDNIPEGLRFAERYGFQLNRHIFESRLQLAKFDEQPFAGVVGRCWRYRRGSA